MPQKTIQSDTAEPIISDSYGERLQDQGKQGIYLEILDGVVKIGRSKLNAQHGETWYQGDEGRIDPTGDGLYFYALDEDAIIYYQEIDWVSSKEESQPNIQDGSTSTATNNVSLSLGPSIKDVDIFVDTSGSATLTVEVRRPGGAWREYDTVSYGSSATQVEQYSTAFSELRARVDSSLNTLELSAKGV